jgi:hypothetical protein
MAYKEAPVLHYDDSKTAVNRLLILDQFSDLSETKYWLQPNKR